MYGMRRLPRKESRRSDLWQLIPWIDIRLARHQHEKAVMNTCRYDNAAALWNRKVKGSTPWQRTERPAGGVYSMELSRIYSRMLLRSRARSQIISLSSRTMDFPHGFLRLNAFRTMSEGEIERIWRLHLQTVSTTRNCRIGVSTSFTPCFFQSRLPDVLDSSLGRDELPFLTTSVALISTRWELII